MLVTFYSKANENIVMFGDVAIKLIKFMGHSGTVPGAIKAEDLPQALEKLEAKTKNMNQTPTNYDEQDAVSLAHRAIPLIKLIKNSIAENCDVLWK